VCLHSFCGGFEGLPASWHRKWREICPAV
jgi:hypothetical protein